MSSFAGDEVGAVVVDVGTHTTKAGFAGEENPKAIVPSVGIDDELMMELIMMMNVR